MAEQAEHGGHHDHTSHYVKIWAILLGLLVVSVVGPMAEIWWLTLITAFGIATVKAILVMKHFMHLDKEMKMVWYVLSGSVILMVLYFFGVAADVMNHNGPTYEVHGQQMYRWDNIAAKAEVERGLAAGDGHHGGEHGEAHGGDHGEAHGDAGHEKKDEGHH